MKKIKELRKGIAGYFGPHPHTVWASRSGGRTVIEVEYEDFQPEQQVKESLRSITGEEVLLSVKRNCSDALMRKVDFLLDGNREDLKFYLIETIT